MSATFISDRQRAPCPVEISLKFNAHDLCSSSCTFYCLTLLQSAINAYAMAILSVCLTVRVMLDCELSMKQHVTKVASSCFYHLRRLKQISRLVGKEVTTQLVSAFTLSRLDYCNTLLAGLPHATTDPLQRVQNAAARLVLSLRLRDHVTPALNQLHWLPVASKVRFKLCLLMHLIHTGRAPQYLVDSVQSLSLIHI